MLKVLIAPDSFKDCLSASEVIEHIQQGLKTVVPDILVTGIPMSDGGEGLLEALIEAKSGKYIPAHVFDPLLREIEAKYGILTDQRIAVIELAEASGLELLQQSERNPLYTSTFGTGQLIKHALDNNCRKLIIGLGGSATNDGGAGIAQALGAGLLDQYGKAVAPGGQGLKDLSSLELGTIDSRLSECEIRVACDVTNPLTGPSGASHVYGPQKGATKDMVHRLDENLKHYASVIKKHLQLDIEQLPGSGAAGGCGAGLVAFLGARLLPGFEVVADILELEQAVRRVDLVITAEGKIDRQTQYGKTPYGVATIARKYQKPVYAFAGTLGDTRKSLAHLGFDDIYPISVDPIPINESIQQAPRLLQETAQRLLKRIL